MVRCVLIIAILMSIFACGDEGGGISKFYNKLIDRDSSILLDQNRTVKGRYEVFTDKTNVLFDKSGKALYIFDFGAEDSPYFEDTIVVTRSDHNTYYRWINNSNIRSANQGGINPLFTDFLMGEFGNELFLNIPYGEYEITFISGSDRSDVLPFNVSIGGKNYKIYSREFGSLASKKGYYAFNTIPSKIRLDSDGLRITFLNRWLINAIIVRSVRDFEVRRFSGLPVRFSNTADFFNLLSRSNAIKWSEKFGYNYEQNWDYLVARSEEILATAGLSDAEILDKLKYIAFYVDELTRESCCEIHEVDVLNSPVDILDPDGFKKGSCFGLARLLGLLANSYGVPARLVGYFVDSDLADFPSLFPVISSPLFVIRGESLYSTFAMGGYNHTEVEIFYNGKWRLITNYYYEPHLVDYSAIDVVNDRGIFTVKRNFYNNVHDVMYVNLYIANVNRQEDYCLLPYSYAFYDINTAASIYPERGEWTFKTDTHTTSVNSLRIGRYWGIVGKLLLTYNYVRRIGREYFLPKLLDRDELYLNILITYSNKNIEENINIYVNNVKIDYTVESKVRNMLFSERTRGVFQFRVKLDKRYIIPDTINSFDIELQDPSSSVEVVIGSNDSRISDLNRYTMEFCNDYDMMRSQESYYYENERRYPLYNNPLLFLELVSN